MKKIDGWDICIWIDAEEGREKAEEIFEAIEKFISETFDVHEPHERCTLSWSLSMSGVSFDDE